MGPDIDCLALALTTYPGGPLLTDDSQRSQAPFKDIVFAHSLQDELRAADTGAAGSLFKAGLGGGRVATGAQETKTGEPQASSELAAMGLV